MDMSEHREVYNVAKGGEAGEAEDGESRLSAVACGTQHNRSTPKTSSHTSRSYLSNACTVGWRSMETPQAYLSPAS